MKDLMRRILSITLVFVIVISLTSCNSKTGVFNSNTKEIVDCAGRTVKIPNDPQRVVCMYASTAHMMAMLGVGEKIVGAADGVKRDVLMQVKYPSIVNVCTPYKEGAINIEALASLNSDLIIIKREMYASDSEREKLDKIGVPYIVVDYYNLDELKKSISVMGNAFTRTEKANNYLKYMDYIFDYVNERVKDIPNDERIRVYHSLTQSTTTDVAGSIVADVFNKAGIRNVSVEAGLSDFGKNKTVTLEEIYNWNPSAIVCNEYAVTDYIKAQKKWAALTAVQNDRVYTLPIGATRWCHHGSMEPQMGALFLASMFYPEKFEDLNINKVVQDYYLKYFDLDFSDNEISEILSGHGMRTSSSHLSME